MRLRHIAPGLAITFGCLGMLLGALAVHHSPAQPVSHHAPLSPAIVRIHEASQR